MKWKLIRIFLPIIVIAFIVPMFLPGPDGKPVMSKDDWVPDEQTVAPVVNSVKRIVQETLNVASDGAQVVGVKADYKTTPDGKFYKWQDEQGNWHFSDKPVTMDGVSMEDLPDAQNTMDAVKIPEEETAAQDMADFSMPTGEGMPGPFTVSPQDIPKLIEQARKLQDVANQRNKALEEM